MIHCLLFSGIPLNDEIRNLLFYTAQEMFSDKVAYQEVKNLWCEGYLKTDWKVSGMGTSYGTVFEAYLETNKGTTTVSFITTHEKIKRGDGVWIPIPDEEEPGFSLN